MKNIPFKAMPILGYFFLAVLTIMSGCTADKYIKQEQERCEKLQATYEQTENDREGLEEEMKLSEQTKKDVQGSNLKTLQQIAALKKEIDRLEKEKYQIEQKIEALHKKEQENRAEASRLRERIKAIQQSIEDKQKQLDELEQYG